MQSTRTALVRPSSAKTVNRNAPARMSLSTVNTVATSLQTLNLSEGMAVTFPAYLAVFLGTLIPCAFLVILYIQGETRKAGEEAGRAGREE